MAAPRKSRVAKTELLLPLLLVMLVVFLDTALQTIQLTVERDRLGNVHAAQDAGLREASILKAEYDAVIGGTVNLDRQGHTDVMPVIEQLKRLGIVQEDPKAESNAPVAK